MLSVPRARYREIGQLVLASLSFEWAPPGCSRPVKVVAKLGERPGRNWGEVYDEE
ncbi:MAG TPA: hypothetical protein VKP64_11045 [Mycobacteriales bacterium]|nr:hypothetical protein [Mycobacteriales bacterium]